MQKTNAGPRPPSSSEFEAWRAEGQRHLEMLDTRAACQAFQRLASAAIERAHAPTAHEALRRAVVGLGECLALSQEADVRQPAFHTLFRAYQADACADADGLTRDIPYLMLRRALPPERAMLIRWARQALATGDGVPAEAYWRLLLDLADAGGAPIDSLLAECGAAGYPGLAAEKLLDMERVGEALLTARRELNDTASLLRFANSPAARGHLQAVMALIAEQLARTFDPHLADWLAERYAERGDLPRALEVRLKLLRAAPSRGNYAQVEALARQLGTWQALQPKLARMLQRSRSAEARAGERGARLPQMRQANGHGALDHWQACIKELLQRFGRV